MVEMYVLLVVNKKRTCNEENKSVPVVPAHLRADVLEVLNQRGYDEDGNKIS